MASKRKAKEQGPEAPKRPQSGYGQFLGEKRAEIGATLLKEGVEKNKVMTATATRGGEMWKALGDAKQKPYNDKSAKLMEAYAKELEEFKSANPDFKKVKKVKRGQGAKPPSRPAGPYAQWMADNRPMLTEMIMKKHNVEKGKAFFLMYQEGKPLWEKVPAAEKKKYEDKVAEAMEKYKEEQKEFKEEHKGEKKGKKGSTDGEPKRPLGTYAQWVADNREMLYETVMKKHGVEKHKAFFMLAKEGKPIFEALSAAEKKKCEDNAQAAKEKFHADKKEWKEKQAQASPEKNNDKAPGKGGGEEEEEEEDDKSAKKRKEGEPKRPVGAYATYLSENRKTVIDNIMKRLSCDFKQATKVIYKEGKPVYDAVPAAEKKKLEDRFTAAKEKYQVQCKAWKATKSGA